MACRTTRKYLSKRRQRKPKRTRSPPQGKSQTPKIPLKMKNHKPASVSGKSPYWFQRHARSVIFMIITLALVGCYLAFTVPVDVFPATNFPRVLIGVDNGVMPIDQMMVTITRPLEEAVNSVPGLQNVRSITSRGSAEIDLFFDWNVDMFQTLQYVNAAISRVQSELPTTAKVTADRLTFAVVGSSLCTRDIAAFTYCSVWNMSTFQSKNRSISAEPRLVIERTF